MYINDKFYCIGRKEDLIDAFNDNGIDYEEVANYFLRFEEPATETFEGLCGDDLYEVNRALANEVEDLDSIITSLKSNSRKGNTRADIATRLEDVKANIEDLSYSGLVYRGTCVCI